MQSQHDQHDGLLRRALRHNASHRSLLAVNTTDTTSRRKSQPFPSIRSYLHSSLQDLLFNMRLLHSHVDGSFSLTRFASNNIPSYAILSHTWEADNQEVTFQDMCNTTGNSKNSYRKIQFCGQQAQKDGLQYFWVDSCCIDQSSSAELSTAINSMFRWYRNAAKCYVYLSDVSTNKHTQLSELSWVSAFYRSRWFTRGWTLQELLAPVSVEFFSQEGMRLGDKESLELQIQQITGISIQALRGDPLSQISIEKRLSWIVNRDTTIEEDIAYSIFGIFDIHMPLIYGEGAIKALHRLGEEIEKSLSLNQHGKPALNNLKHQIANLWRGLDTEGTRMPTSAT